MEIHENDPRLLLLVGNFPVQKRMLHSSSFLWEPGASFPGFTGAQGVQVDAATLQS